MDEFARLMLREGVRPLAQGGNTTPDRNKAETESPKAQPASESTAPIQNGPSWVSGPEARRTLESAISMIQEDRIQGKPVWITGVHQNGKPSPIRSQASFAEIISQADREKLRLIVLGGDAWTCIMHPEMGIATIETDAA